MECVICGSTNFIKESGYYFCSECQTQSQEVKEHAFQEEAAHVNIKSTRKIKDTKPSKVDHLTSWECYNVILLSLTEELIQLGADVAIKKIVKCLWMKYLEKLEVINLEEDLRPKLPLVNITKDVKIAFGVKKRKRRKRSSSSTSVSESTSRRERSKKKTALAKSQYTEIVSRMEDRSLHNETLTSLKSSTEKSEASERINFNKYSAEVLRKKMTKRHLENHLTDLSSNLKCHKFTYKTFSGRYANGIYFVSPIKIYSILYISLLIQKDNIQLGDLFRFLREGHLNFDRFSSLFPESYADKILNIHDHTKKSLFSHREFRNTTGKLVEFLEVESYIECPDVVELTQRYCLELNLPDEILNAVKRIISKNPMKFGGNRRQFPIPNYDARVMSLIIFVLKLLYGLDDVTEKHLSNYARKLNEEYPDKKMFDIQSWMEFIRYRHLVVSEYHFPTYQLNNSDMNTELFLQYKSSHNIFEDDRRRLVSDMVGYKNMLSKIKNLQNDYNTQIEYPPSLTPFTDYSDIITDLSNEEKTVLKSNFQDNSLDFLLHPMDYLVRINENVTYKSGGANDDCILEKMKTQDQSVYVINKKIRNFVLAEIFKESNDKTQNIKLSTENADITEQFEQNLNLSHKNAENSYDLHYSPYERYWLYLRGRIDLASKDQIEDHFNKLGNSFKIIFNECSRIIEQNNRELFAEFQNTEMYLIYCGNYKGAEKRRRLSKLKWYINLAETEW